MIPPMNFSFRIIWLVPIPSNSASSTHRKRSIPSSKKRAHLTVQLRNEILKLQIPETNDICLGNSTEFITEWNLCTAQTLPHVNRSILFEKQTKFFH